MEIHQVRLNDNGRDATLSAVYINQIGNLFGFTCEDEKRAFKINGETRIPAGRYEIKLRAAGGMHGSYAERFPDIHRGMLHLQDVPAFEWVYYHVGNTDDHSEGCPLLGFQAHMNNRGGSVGQSTRAYKQFYLAVVAALDVGERVFTTIYDPQDWRPTFYFQ